MICLKKFETVNFCFIFFNIRTFRRDYLWAFTNTQLYQPLLTSAKFVLFLAVHSADVNFLNDFQTVIEANHQL